MLQGSVYQSHIHQFRGPLQPDPPVGAIFLLVPCQSLPFDTTKQGKSCNVTFVLEAEGLPLPEAPTKRGPLAITVHVPRHHLNRSCGWIPMRKIHGGSGRFNIFTYLGGGNSNIFYFHPENWGR